MFGAGVMAPKVSKPLKSARAAAPTSPKTIKKSGAKAGSKPSATTSATRSQKNSPVPSPPGGGSSDIPTHAQDPTGPVDLPLPDAPHVTVGSVHPSQPSMHQSADSATLAVNVQAAVDLKIVGMGTNWKPFVQLDIMHSLDTLPAGPCKMAYEVQDARYAASPASDFELPKSEPMRKLGNYVPGMTRGNATTEKVAWLNAVVKTIGAPLLGIKCDSIQQKVRIEFGALAAIDRATAKKLLQLWNEYLGTGVMNTSAGPQGRKYVQGRGVINERQSQYGGGEQVQWFPSCFVNFPEPPEVDGVDVVEPTRNLRNKKPMEVLVQEEKERKKNAKK